MDIAAKILGGMIAAIIIYVVISLSNTAETKHRAKIGEAQYVKSAKQEVIGEAQYVKSAKQEVIRYLIYFMVFIAVALAIIFWDIS